MFNTFEETQSTITYLKELGLYIKSNEFNHKQFGNEILYQLQEKCIKDGICYYCGSNDLKPKNLEYVNTSVLVCEDCGLIQTDEPL